MGEAYVIGSGMIRFGKYPEKTHSKVLDLLSVWLTEPTSNH